MLLTSASQRGDGESAKGSRTACDDDPASVSGSLHAGRGVDATEITAFRRRVGELDESFAALLLTSLFCLKRKALCKEGLVLITAADRNILTWRGNNTNKLRQVVPRRYG